MPDAHQTQVQAQQPTNTTVVELRKPCHKLTYTLIEGNKYIVLRFQDPNFFQKRKFAYPAPIPLLYKDVDKEAGFCGPLRCACPHVRRLPWDIGPPENTTFHACPSRSASPAPPLQCRQLHPALVQALSPTWQRALLDLRSAD